MLLEGFIGKGTVVDYGVGGVGFGTVVDEEVVV